MKKRALVRVGLVELQVTAKAGASGAKFATLSRAAHADGPGRLRTVLRVLKHEDTQKLDAIVFPGWTLAGEALPKSVVAACGERVVVLEGMGPPPRSKPGSEASYPWTTYVVWRGAIVARARQLLAIVVEASEQTVVQLRAELEGPRVFAHPALGRTALLVCGEPNVVRENGASAVPAFDTILNPAHTPSLLPAMRRKRARLAVDGTLFTTANTHEGWTPKDGRAQPAARRAAEWFQRGERGPRPASVAIAPGATLSVVELRT